MHGLTGEEQALAHRLHQRAPPRLPARRRGRERTEREGVAGPSRHGSLADCLLNIGAVEAGEPTRCKVCHCGFALELARDLAGHLDDTERRA